MKPEQIDEIIAQKRLIHPELQEALTWDVFLSICAREGVTVVRQPLPRDATLVNFDGEWTIGINSAKGSPRHDTADGAHELAHLWIHVDATSLGRSVCFNHGYGSNPDPREDEADYCAAALLYGPKYFPTLAPAGVVSRLRKPLNVAGVDLSPVTIVGEGTYTLALKGCGELSAQAALKSLVGGEDLPLLLQASLLPERSNHYDSKAVRVEIADRLVGYLSRKDARVYRRNWAGRPTRANAMIIGGRHPSFPAMDVFSVRLDLSL